MAATLTAGTDAEDRIAHLETSLATALARVEAGQLREQRLKRENAELRSLLRDAGLDSAEGKRDKDGQPLGPIIPQPGHSKRIGQNRSTSLEPCLDGDDLMQGVHALSVDIATPEGKLPALLLASDDCLEFVELRARITPSEFVGIKSCKYVSSKGRRQLSRRSSSGSGRRSVSARSWLWRIFSPSPKPSASTTPAPGSPNSDSPGVGNEDDVGGSRPSLNSSLPSSMTSHVPSGPIAKYGPTKTSNLGALARISCNGMVGTDWQHQPAQPTIQSQPPAGNAEQQLMSREDSQLPGDDIPQPPPSINPDPCKGDEDIGAWDILWKAGGGTGALKTMTFMASSETREYIHQRVESWAEQQSQTGTAQDGNKSAASVLRPTLIRMSAPPMFSSRVFPPEAAVTQAAGESEPEAGTSCEPVQPVHMVAGKWMPHLSTASDILSEHDIACLCHQLPRRMHQAPWELAYSTDKHGISLSTLFRNAAKWAYSILVVSDGAGYVFGSFCTEAWKMSPRYFGTGESFVFQLRPHLIAYPWHRKSKTRNNFYQFATPDSIAVGGGGHFALWIDQDLAFGNSGLSDTFCNPCLSSSTEFRVKAIELWGIAA